LQEAHHGATINTAEDKALLRSTPSVDLVTETQEYQFTVNQERARRSRERDL